MELEKFGLVLHICSTVKIGDKFGHLTIKAIGKTPGDYRPRAVCDCDCGTTNKIIRLDGIVGGAVTGCGCVQRARTKTHGLTKHPLYQVWHLMMLRCHNPTDKSFANYGGRGIKVCERWHSVENFVADMNQTWAPHRQIDRINNDGNYEHGNCRWVTKSENCDNRRSGRKLTFGGRTQSISRWAEEMGINRGTISERLDIWGWSIERTLTTPPLSKDERMAIARIARWGKSTIN